MNQTETMKELIVQLFQKEHRTQIEYDLCAALQIVLADRGFVLDGMALQNKEFSWITPRKQGE